MRLVRIGFIFIISFCISFQLYAQRLLQYFEGPLMEDQVHSIEKYKKRLFSNSPGFIVRINSNATLNENTYIVFPDSSMVIMSQTEVTWHDEDEYTVTGKGINGEIYSITYMNGRMSGQLRDRKTSWKLSSIGGGLMFMYKPSDYMLKCKSPGHEGKPSGYDIMKRKYWSPDDRGANAVDDCNVRLLFFYTNAADSASNSMILDRIKDYITYFNIANSNSEVEFKVELARAVRTPYTESYDKSTGGCGPVGKKLSTDLQRFQDLSDGYMDLVDDYRDAYDADLCLLIVDALYEDWLGEACTTGANYNKAFAVAVDWWDLAVVHECGHLFGCKHDPFTIAHGDSCHMTGAATGCAHGYVNLNPGNEFATIMAYQEECICEDESCGYIQNWSNPDITENGDPTGTECANPLARENNAKKLNDDWTVQRDHEPYIANKSWNYTSPPALQDEVIDVREFGDLLGEFTLKVAENSSTSYTVKSGGEAQFRAGNEITLYPGFSAQSGSSVNAFLDSCSEPAQITGDGPVVKSEFHNEETGGPVFEIVPKLNSENGVLSIKCVLGIDSEVSVTLVNDKGRNTSLMDSAKRESGIYELTTDLSNMGDGPFELRMDTNSGLISSSIAYPD